MTDKEIAQAYVNYFRSGEDKSYYWAIEELTQLSIENSSRAWKIIQIINAMPVDANGWWVDSFYPEWTNDLYAALGCGPLENIIAIYKEAILPEILQSAMNDKVLRKELSTIYESSIDKNLWLKIQTVLRENSV